MDEIVAMMLQAREDRHGWRLRAVIVPLWRGGLRVQEALALWRIGEESRSTARPT